MRFSEKVNLCQQSPIRKFYPDMVAAKNAGKKVYHLNIGQPDVETPKAYFDAVANFQQPVLEYAPSPGIPALIDQIRRYYARLGVSYEQEDILVTTGGSEALQLALLCILNPGDEVIIPEPFYPNYSTFVYGANGVICPLTTRVEENYHYADRERLEALINDRTRAMVITNPGNPTGTVLTQEEMRMIADVAKEHELFLIVDEVYREFFYRGDQLMTMGRFDDIDENLVLVDSVSKRFSACGARIGCLISRNRELIGHALKFCQSRLSVATLDQVAAAALYDVEPSYFEAMRQEYCRRRDTVVEGLRKIPGVQVACPDGAFYLMAKLPVENAEEFQTWLLREFDDHGETVMFAPGEGFYGTPGKGKDEIRIAYVLNQKDLARSMELLGLGLQRYQADHGKNASGCRK